MRLQSEFLSTEHFLLGIIKTDNSARDFRKLQADLTQIRRKINEPEYQSFCRRKDSISLTNWQTT